MTPLAGPEREASKKGPLYWSLAGLFALSLHSAVVALHMLRPTVPNRPEMPAAAPFAVELAMFMAAPQDAAKEVPPGPEQVQAQKAPVTPPEVVEQKLPELPVVERPVEVPIQKPVVAERPKPEPKPEVKSEPAKEVSEVSAPETAAPPSTVVAQVSDRVTAPLQGALGQQVINAKQQWHSILQAHLERRKRPPRQSARQQGEAVVRFTMARNGQVLSVALQQSSGVPAFDREAQALIRRAVPLPRPPAEVAGDPLTLTLPIRFTMQ